MPLDSELSVTVMGLGYIGLPTAAVLEGGYSADLPQLIDGFLTAWAG